MARYFMTLNGFRIVNQTWDDPLQWDGKGDEVYIRSVNKKLMRDGTLVYSTAHTSATMGDTNNQPGRIKAGSLSNAGGLN